MNYESFKHTHTEGKTFAKVFAKENNPYHSITKKSLKMLNVMTCSLYCPNLREIPIFLLVESCQIFNL